MSNAAQDDNVVTRNAIRSAILGLKPKSKIVTVAGIEVELRQPSIKDFLAASEQGRGQMLISMVVQYCYVPGTDIKVFDEADFEGLSSIPVGADWMELTQAIDALTEVREGAAEVKKD